MTINITKNITAISAVFLIFGLIIYSCGKLYIKQDFRQTYNIHNDSIHQKLYTQAFFKVHLKNGNVSVLNEWELNESKDSLFGKGKLFDFNRAEIKDGSIAHEIDEIAIIETNQLDAIKSKDSDKISGLAILTGVNLILDIVCITNPKACFGSCPTFYTNNSLSVHDAKAEGFSSSISPSLETTDMDALKTSTSDESFYLTMKNEAFETHLINELFLNVVSKKKSEYVFHDKNNLFHKSDQLYIPKTAQINNTSILDLITDEDELEFYSKTNENDLTTKDEIYLEFDNIPSQNIGLTINFRQTLLTTFLLYNGLSYMGDEVGDYFAKIETNESIKKRLSHPFSLLGKIKLFAYDDNKNKWILFDELYETGPIAKNMMIAPLNNIEPIAGSLKIKIEMTKGLWKIDYLGLANIKNTTTGTKIYPNKIEVIEGKDYNINAIKSDDNNYLTSFPGNEFKYKFKLPELGTHEEHELFLSSKGYYLEWIRANWLKEKNIKKLEKMLSNDKEVWTSLALEYKIVEDEMEEVFWNSKYINLQ
ncbi:hypothetical protein GCM10023314_04190 [Algibacter agarivorans]|uniref:Lipoprotein n=1 Tax=Algibacter agarivorans TaxID=1109741 RepID=A0ABP9GA65_9FLAO